MALGVKVPIITELNSKGFKSAYAEFKKLEGASAKAGFLMKKAFSPAGFAAISGAAVTAAYAIYDMAKAAGEDQASQAILAKALENTTGATDAQIASVEKLISTMQLATGIADTDLRTGFQNLVRSTRDVTKSQELLNLAVDVSRGSSKDLGTVTTALGKAYNGQVSALKKLGLPLDQNIIKTNDFEAAVRSLFSTYNGSGAEYATTFAGQMDIIRQRVGEAQEALGAVFIPTIASIADFIAPAINGVQKLADAIAWLNEKAKDNAGVRSFLTAINPLKLFGLQGAANGGYQLADALTDTDDAAKNATSSLDRLLMVLKAETVETWRVQAGVANLNSYLNSLGYDTEVVAQETRSLGGSFTDTVSDIERFAEAVAGAQKELAGMVSGYLDLNAAAEAGSIRGFVGSVSGQAAQIKNLAKNLGTLSGRGLAPQAIQGIMSLDLGTAASLAQDLVNSAFSTRYIRQLNTAYQGIASTATSFGQTFGANFMTGGAAPVTQNITITNPNPRAVVQAIREYGRNAGPIPIAVTGSF
jgi:hypothetical protein